MSSDARKPNNIHLNFFTDEDQAKEIDTWRGREYPIMTRSKALRILVDIGLAAEKRNNNAERRTKKTKPPSA